MKLEIGQRWKFTEKVYNGFYIYIAEVINIFPNKSHDQIEVKILQNIGLLCYSPGSKYCSIGLSEIYQGKTHKCWSLLPNQEKTNEQG